MSSKLLEVIELSGFSADKVEVSDSEDNDLIPSVGDVSFSDEDSPASTPRKCD